MRSRYITAVLALTLSFVALCQAQNAPQGKLPPCDSTKFDCTCKPPKPINRSVKPKGTPLASTAPAQETKTPEPANQLGPWVNALVEIQSTNQKLLLLQQENYADELRFKRERLENVEEPAQDTNLYRAETERELADDKEVNDDKLTDAKIANDGQITIATVGLMKAQGRAMQIDAWGNLIGAGLSPLTSYLGRTQISTSTTMNQGSVSGGNLTNGPVSVSSSNANNSAGGAGGSNSTSVTAAGGAGGNSSNSNSNIAKGGTASNSNSNTARGGAATNNNSTSSSNSNSNANSNNNTAQGGAGGNSSSSSTGGQGGNSDATGGNASSSAAANQTQGQQQTASPSQSQSQVASPTQSQTANPSQSQSQTANPTATGGDQSQSQTTPPSN